MKKYIKNIGIIVLATGLLTAASGCKKFLDRKPLTADLNDLSTGALEGQVLGMYNILRTYAGFSTLPWLDFQSIRDDDANKGSDINDGKEVVAEFDTYQYTKDDWAPNTYWNDHYAMINAANDALYVADSLQVTDEPSLRNVGEACFFRAYAYFELVKTYGDVPLINFKIKNANDGLIDKSPAATIYTFIDSNLLVAASYLPLTWELDGKNAYPGRLTKGAANALWAQTHLFRGDWAQVIGLCNQVIASGQYQLLDNFSSVFKDGLNGAGKNSRESVFEMQANVGKNGQSIGAVNNGSGWGTCQQPRKNGNTDAWNLGWGWNVPSQKLVTDWDSTDPRKSETILYSGKYDGGDALGGHGAVFATLYKPGWRRRFRPEVLE